MEHYVAIKNWKQTLSTDTESVQTHVVKWKTHRKMNLSFKCMGNIYTQTWIYGKKNEGDAAQTVNGVCEKFSFFKCYKLGITYRTYK